MPGREWNATIRAGRAFVLTDGIACAKKLWICSKYFSVSRTVDRTHCENR